MVGRLFAIAATVFFAWALSTWVARPRADTVAGSSGTMEATAPALPATLDALYTPKAPRPVLLLAMQGLNATLAGIVVDISENDRQGALGNFESFERQYQETGRIVPEWESWYPIEPVEELETVLSNGTPADIMAAVEKVGAVCHSCHLATMVPVQHKYHWPDFATVTVRDPVADVDLAYPAFMQMLNASLIGVGNDLRQEQADNAMAQLVALRSRMVALQESCDACHDTERAYFVGEPIETLLDKMQAALDGPSSDPAVVAQMSRRIGEASCSGCHLVHLPAAYSQPAHR